MNPKKVLLSAYACSPIRGSEPGNGWSWATGLAAKGFEVWCFTNTEDEKEIMEAGAKLNLPNLHFVFVRMPFIDKHFLDTGSKKIYLHYAMWKKKAARLAKMMHSEIHFDVAHHVTFGSLQQGNFLWKLKDVKIIFGPVGGGQKALPIFKEYFGEAWRTEKIRDLITNWSISFSTNFKNSILKSDYVLVTNPDTFEMATIGQQSSNDKVHFVADNAVPDSMKNLSIENRKSSTPLRLLWVGRMLPRKGLNLVLESLSRLPANIDYTLDIVGGGELFSSLEGWIKKFNLDGRKIHITGQIPFDDVKKYYQHSDVFIFCSLRDSFPAQLTEAMAFGLPVIVLNIHGSAIGVPDNCGIKVSPVDKEQTLNGIAAAISRMYSDIDFRNRCSANAYLQSQGNTWEKKIESVVEKYY